MMTPEKLDCGWCGSARSIEYGICQICLMEYPVETKIVRLPLDRERAGAPTRVLDLREGEVRLAE